MLMSNRLKLITVCANDFDGVFYKPHKVADYYQQFVDVFAATLVNMFPKLIDFDGAKSISINGYKQYGDSVTALMAWAQQNSLDREKVRDQFFYNYHVNLKNHFQKHAPGVFDFPSKLAKDFIPLQGIVRHGIATHGCANQFVRPLLAAMELEPYIVMSAIFGLSDSGYLTKAEHPDLVMMCLEALGIDPESNIEEASYTEDTTANLEKNREYMPKLTTVFIHHNVNPFRYLPSYIDYQFRSFADFLKALRAAHSEGPQIYVGGPLPA